MAYRHNCVTESNQVKITLNCFKCKELQTVIAPINNYLEWQAGKYIQDAMPMLNVDQREMLLSGICPSCWDKLFGEPE
jgi:hypothetical protein